MNGKSRLTLDIDSDLHERLKIVAARQRITMRDFCIRAIEQRLSQEQKNYLTAEEAPLLAELWDNEKDAIYDDV
jgi:hypothetical protein